MGDGMDVSKVNDKELITKANIKSCFHYQRIGSFLLLLVLVLVCLVVVVKFCGFKNIVEEKAVSLAKRFDISYPWKEMKLPKSIYPMKYWLHLTLNPYDWDYFGEMKIKFGVAQETNILVLNIDGLTTIAARIVDSNDKQVSIISQSAYSVYESYIVETVEPFKKGEVYYILLTYVAMLKGDSTGLYKQTFPGRDGLSKFYIGSHFFPINARKAFPCFDEPGIRAVFSIAITHPNDTVALSSTELESSEYHEDGMVTDTFRDTPPMPPHLLAIFVFNDLDNITEFTKDGHMIRIWCTPNFLEEARNVSSEIKHYHNVFAQFFGMNDSLIKTDFLVLSHLPAHAMEYWGLYVYEEHYMFPREAWHRLIRSLMLGASVAHEWFGSSTGVSWWDEVWIERGIAGALAFYALPNEILGQRMALFSKFSSMYLESNYTVPPMYNPITSTQTIRYLHIEQTRAISLIRMIWGAFGEENFMKAMQLCALKHQWESLNALQIWNLLDQTLTYPHNTKDIIESWFTSEGFPVVTVKKLDDGNFQVDLKRFMINRGRYLSVYKEDWIVPFTYITNVNYRIQITWINGTKPTKIEDKSEWLLGNANLMGYYLVNYEEALWEKLFIYILSNETNLEHTGLMVESTSHDLTELGKAGMLPENIESKVDLLRYAIAQKLAGQL